MDNSIYKSKVDDPLNLRLPNIRMIKNNYEEGGEPWLRKQLSIDKDIIAIYTDLPNREDLITLAISHEKNKYKQ